MKTISTWLLTILTSLSPMAGAASPPDPELVFATAATDSELRDRALTTIDQDWRQGYVPMLLDLVSLSTSPELNRRLIDLLEGKTGEEHGYDLRAWQEWLWSRDTLAGEEYARFKALLYRRIDPRIAGYFSEGLASRIRLDEVVWGGVKQDGIPPLRDPLMISAREAGYLDGRDRVFALAINGDHRAYPQRILGWHEMFTDTVGGVPIAGVYCTLCGAMVVYRTEVDGQVHQLGTSGLLYRSNKLMYDRATQSLWSTLRGEPVIGELAESGITLERLPVVTTTWKAWRKQHPDTKVLSLETGHRRDYSEGAAYREYFATDELMFPVSTTDRRLRNKEPILGLHFGDSQLAISVRYLSKHRLYTTTVGELPVVILTDRSGANRAYEAKDLQFDSWKGDREVIDSRGKRWLVQEDYLVAEGGDRLHRLAAHQSFWFGWYAAFPKTSLID